MSASTRCQATIKVEMAGLNPRVIECILGYAQFTWDPGKRWFHQHLQTLADVCEGAAYYACLNTLEAAMVLLGGSRADFIEFDRATRFPEAEKVRRVVRRAIVLARSDAQRNG